MHLISVDDLTTSHITAVLEKAQLLQSRHEWETGSASMKGKLLATVFFEPSTRTRLSFEAAMTYLGGNVIGTENAEEFSSIKKGASIPDEFRVVSGYCDIIVGRFRNEGDARIAAKASMVPVINGGDGQGEHPSQALIDYYTIWDHFGSGPPLRITFVGDNRRSRTVRSLVRMLTKFNVITMTEIDFVSPHGLHPDEAMISQVTDAGMVAGSINNLDPRWIELSDVIYVTRAQNERSDEKFDGSLYALTPELVDLMPEHGIVMHPLPRNSELPATIDNNRRAKYFEQAHNGLYVRMALLERMLRY